MRRRLTALAVATALTAVGAGCGDSGDGDDLVDEGGLRECLADAGFGVEPPDLSVSAGLGNASADFRATSADGVAVDFVVLGNERKAERTAADISAARAGLGGAGGELVAQRNAIAVFAETPSGEARGAVEDCLAG
jgi:hypothetical protein